MAGRGPTSEEKAITHLEAIREDIRNEIKQRIKQRDTYSVQLTIALSAIVALSFSPAGFMKALIAAPLVSIYFTVLILYSYRIHRLLAHYLRDEIEPELARLCGTSPVKEWEGYYFKQAIAGIRRLFFMVSLWVCLLVSMGFLWLTQRADPTFELALTIATSLYLLATAVITWQFWKR